MFRVRATALTLALMAGPAAAHFQLVYTPEVNLDGSGDIGLELIFWHPMDNGPVMDMGTPEEVFVRFRGETTDLTPSLAPFTFRGSENEGQAYRATASITRPGDYTFVVVPEPYFEPTEDLYIQQFAKSVVSRGALPTDWMEPVGLAAEILPLNKPYGLLVGSTFTGVVLADGEPVGGAEIEIEHMSAEPNPATATPTADAGREVPGGALVTITKADGSFTFGIPAPGFWGFVALGVGAQTEHEGKPLSQDAVLWVYAHELD